MKRRQVGGAELDGATILLILILVGGGVFVGLGAAGLYDPLNLFSDKKKTGDKKRCKCSHGTGVVVTDANPCPTDGKDKCASCNHMHIKKGDTCTPCSVSQKAAKSPDACKPQPSSSSGGTIHECDGTTPNCICTDKTLMKDGENCVPKSDTCGSNNDSRCEADCMADLITDNAKIICKSKNKDQTMELTPVNSDAKHYTELCPTDKVLVKRSNTSTIITKAKAKKLQKAEDLMYNPETLKLHDFACRKQCNCGSPTILYQWTTSDTRTNIGTHCGADYMSADAKDKKNKDKWLSLDCPVGTGLNFRLADNKKCKSTQFYDELNDKCVDISQGSPCRAPWEEEDPDAKKQNVGKPKKTTLGYNLSTVSGTSCKPKTVNPSDKTSIIWCGVDAGQVKKYDKSADKVLGSTVKLGSGDQRCMTRDHLVGTSKGSSKNSNIVFASACRMNELRADHPGNKFDNTGGFGPAGCPLPTSPQNWRLKKSSTQEIGSFRWSGNGSCPPDLKGNNATGGYPKYGKQRSGEEIDNGCPYFASSTCHWGDDDMILKCEYEAV